MGLRRCHKIDIIQHKAMRYYLGVNKFAPILGMQRDMRWYEPKIRRCIKRIRFWNKLVKLDDSRLTKKAFNADYEQCRNNWSHHMRELFRSLHLENNSNNKQTVNIGNITDTIHENARATWLDSIIRKPKLKTYVTFKSSFNTENYVNFCTDMQDQSLMARTRLGILPIKVKTGRYKNISTNERLCESCGELEDELHFLLHCNLYVHFRQELYKQGERGTVGFTVCRI